MEIRIQEEKIAISHLTGNKKGRSRLTKIPFTTLSLWGNTMMMRVCFPEFGDGYLPAKIGRWPAGQFYVKDHVGCRPWKERGNAWKTHCQRPEKSIHAGEHTKECTR